MQVHRPRPLHQRRRHLCSGSSKDRSVLINVRIYVSETPETPPTSRSRNKRTERFYGDGRRRSPESDITGDTGTGGGAPPTAQNQDMLGPVSTLPLPLVPSHSAGVTESKPEKQQRGGGRTDGRRPPGPTSRSGGRCSRGGSCRRWARRPSPGSRSGRTWGGGGGQNQPLTGPGGHLTVSNRKDRGLTGSRELFRDRGRAGRPGLRPRWGFRSNRSDSARTWARRCCAGTAVGGENRVGDR